MSIIRVTVAIQYCNWGLVTKIDHEHLPLTVNLQSSLQSQYEALTLKLLKKPEICLALQTGNNKKQPKKKQAER